MNQNDTSIPTVSFRIIWMIGVRQSSYELSHSLSCADAPLDIHMDTATAVRSTRAAECQPFPTCAVMRDRDFMIPLASIQLDDSSVVLPSLCQLRRSFEHTNPSV